MCQYLIAFYGCIILHSVYQLHFVYSSVGHIFAILNDVNMNILVYKFVYIALFDSFANIPRGSIAESCGNYVFNFFEETPIYFPQWLCHIAFPSAMYEGSYLATISPIVSFFVFIKATLVGVKWYFSVYISLITNDFGKIFKCFLTMCIASLEKLFKFLA